MSWASISHPRPLLCESVGRTVGRPFDRLSLRPAWEGAFPRPQSDGQRPWADSGRLGSGGPVWGLPPGPVGVAGAEPGRGRTRERRAGGARGGRGQRRGVARGSESPGAVRERNGARRARGSPMGVAFPGGRGVQVGVSLSGRGLPARPELRASGWDGVGRSRGTLPAARCPRRAGLLGAAAPLTAPSRGTGARRGRGHGRGRGARGRPALPRLAPPCPALPCPALPCPRPPRPSRTESGRRA